MSEGLFSRGNQAAQQLLSQSSLLRSNAALGYGVALVAFSLSLGLRFALDTTIPGYPFITFIPAVIITAFLAGSGAGALCGALSFLAIWYWFVDPMEPFSTSKNSVVGLGLFGFIIVVETVLVEIATRFVDRLAAQQAQLKTIFETVPLGLIMAEFPSGRIVTGNKYIERMFGHPIIYSSDVNSYGEWVGFHEDGSRVDGHEYPLAAMMLRGEEHPSIDVQRPSADGTRAWVRIMGRPVKDNAGRMTGGVVAVIDIDEQRKTQIALKEALQAKETLLYEVNHRVKNSLQLVNSFLLLEAEKIAESDARSAIMAARDKVDMIGHIHQLLYESGTHNGVDLKPAVEEIIQDLIISAGRSDVQLDFCFSGDLMVNIRQASPLVLVINEIVTNALKYGLSSQEPKLNVSVVNARGVIELEIKDNGPGIVPATPGKKPGMGSQIIEGLVAQMRARLLVESDCSGTKIALTVPIDPPSSDMKGTG